MKRKYRFVVDRNFGLAVESYPLGQFKKWLILKLTGWLRIEDI